MELDDLRARITQAGLDPRRLVRIATAMHSHADPEVAYNVVRVEHRFGVRAAAGRGLLSDAPYPGFAFETESAALDYVWRRIRTLALPASLTDDERAANRSEAETAVARRNTAPYT